MTPPRTLSVLVPVYNERATIERLLNAVVAVDTGLALEVLVADDGSSDGTREILHRLEEHGVIDRLIFQPKNMGKGAAVRTAIQAATGDIMVIQDADLEYDPSEYPRLIEPILDGRARVVYGSRFLAGRPPAPFISVLANRALTAATNLLYGARITDMETCYKIMAGDVARSLRLEANRFDIEPEITAKLLKAGHRILELPVRFEPRSRAQGSCQRQAAASPISASSNSGG